MRVLFIQNYIGRCFYNIYRILMLQLIRGGNELITRVVKRTFTHVRFNDH